MDVEPDRNSDAASVRQFAEETVERIGERIRRSRVQLGLTLREVAKVAGVSAGTVQKVESGRLVPSVAVFVKIAKALHRRASYFLGDDEEQERVDLRVIRKRKRNLVPTGSRFRIEAIAEALRDSRLEAYVLTIPRGAESGEPLGYSGELLFFCMRGRINFNVRHTEEVLRSGDTLHLKADIPHRWRNAANRPAELLIVWSPT
jgi:transcriptional regulator with XRE-family HTH domain